MESRLKIVKRELRALKKSSHAIKRLIELQGIHFKRVKALQSLSTIKEGNAILEKEKELMLSICLKTEIEKSQKIEEKYLKEINKLDESDKAMVLDYFFNGMPFWKLGMEYGFSEEGARKHIDAIVKKIARNVE